jgi:heme/copper-type cytochrome/quinol oxidase subunit 2
LGDVIAMIAKIFAYFILGCVLFSIVAALFGVGVVGFGLLPIKDFIINDGWQNVFAWGTLILFIWVPVIGIITWIIRKLIKAKRNSALLRGTFIALNVLGWVCFISLLASISRDFKYTSTANEETVKLSNTKVDKLEVNLSGYNKYYKNRKHWLEIEPFNGILDDTAYVPNTRIKLIRSTTDSFQVTVTRLSQGRTKSQANELAEKITYSIEQKDSILSLYKGIPINNTDKFRNQRVLITIAVPVGKRILIDDKIGWMHDVYVGFNEDDNWARDFYGDEDFDWETGKEYIMTEKGLKRVSSDKYIYDDDNDNEKSPEELKREIDEKQRELDEKKKELDRDIQDRLKQIEEDKRKLEKAIDSTKAYRYQKTASLARPNTTNAELNDDETIGEDNMRPSLLNSFRIAG